MRVLAGCLLVVLTALSVFADPPALPPDYPQSLERDLAALLAVCTATACSTRLRAFKPTPEYEDVFARLDD